MDVVIASETFNVVLSFIYIDSIIIVIRNVLSSFIVASSSALIVRHLANCGHHNDDIVTINHYVIIIICLAMMPVLGRSYLSIFPRFIVLMLCHDVHAMSPNAYGVFDVYVTSSNAYGVFDVYVTSSILKLYFSFMLRHRCANVLFDIIKGLIYYVIDVLAFCLSCRV